MITDVEPDVAQARVDTGSYEALPESAWDDPEIIKLIGKYPNTVQTNQSTYVTTVGPDGYKIEAVSEAGGYGWYVHSRSGRPLNYKPIPNRAAAISLAERHHSGTGAVRGAMEAQAEQDRVESEAFFKADDARRQAIARANGGR